MNPGFAGNVREWSVLPTMCSRLSKLPTTNEGMHKMIVDARGGLWYMGSHSGKLGVVE